MAVRWVGALVMVAGLGCSSGSFDVAEGDAGDEGGAVDDTTAPGPEDGVDTRADEDGATADTGATDDTGADALADTLADTFAVDAPDGDAGDGGATTDVGADATDARADVTDAGAPDTCVKNACGGCTALAHAPESICGRCGAGRWKCSGGDAVVCEDPFTGPLPGSACGTCSTLLRICAPDGKSAVCPGDDHNGCGGCSAVSPAKDTVCGTCGSGKYVCDGTTATRCADPVTTPASGTACGTCGLDKYVCATDKLSTSCSGNTHNGCGGCTTLTNLPGKVCGKCSSGKYECDPSNKNATVCNDPVPTTSPPPGSACGSCGTLKIQCATDGRSTYCPGNDLNGCGGCVVLPNPPLTACGICLTSTYTCDGTNATYCTKLDDRTIGDETFYATATTQVSAATEGAPGTATELLAFTMQRTGAITAISLGLQYKVELSEYDAAVTFRLLKGTSPATATVIGTTSVLGSTFAAGSIHKIVFPTTEIVPKGARIWIELTKSEPYMEVYVLGGPATGPAHLGVWNKIGTAWTEVTTLDPYLRVWGNGCY
ncbi:MAG: hypothetical protein HYV09_30205 [Deltaproteobacteria bacterium]|nr:hypothetical protein [Deltaproteobacteria bacterium]